MAQRGLKHAVVGLDVAVEVGLDEGEEIISLRWSGFGGFDWLGFGEGGGFGLRGPGGGDSL